MTARRELASDAQPGAIAPGQYAAPGRRQSAAGAHAESPALAATLRVRIEHCATVVPELRIDVGRSGRQRRAPQPARLELPRETCRRIARARVEVRDDEVTALHTEPHSAALRGSHSHAERRESILVVHEASVARIRIVTVEQVALQSKVDALGQQPGRSARNGDALVTAIRLDQAGRSGFARQRRVARVARGQAPLRTLRHVAELRVEILIVASPAIRRPACARNTASAAATDPAARSVA